MFNFCFWIVNYTHLFRSFITSARVIAFSSFSIASWTLSSLSSRMLWIFFPTGQFILGFSWKWNSVFSSMHSTAWYTSRKVISSRAFLFQLWQDPADDHRVHINAGSQEITGYLIFILKIFHTCKHMYGNCKSAWNLHGRLLSLYFILTSSYCNVNYYIFTQTFQKFQPALCSKQSVINFQLRIKVIDMPKTDVYNMINS